MQRQVLEFVQALQAFPRRGVPGKQLLQFAGAIPLDDLELMRQAIEDECERVDLNEWPLPITSGKIKTSTTRSNAALDGFLPCNFHNLS